MHSAWQNDDIRYFIFERLKPRDLAQLAQTCKAFSETTTDELWKSVNSFSQILSCLPPDFRTRPLRTEDLRRFNLYTFKCQNLVLETKSVQRVIRLPAQFDPKKKQSKNHPEKSWKELWDELANLRASSEFLPNLRRLRISNVAEELLIPLIGISGANLTQISIRYIHYPQPENIVRQILYRLQETPKLEYIFLRDGEDIVPSKIIQQAPLKHLRLDPRIHAKGREDFQFKKHPLRTEILQKSTLEKLTIGLTAEWLSPESKVLMGRYLPQLKELWLNLTAFNPPGHGLQYDFNRTRSPAVFLEGLDNPELSLLNIKFPIEVTGPMFLDVVAAANRSCRLKSLKELALAGGGWFNNVRILRCFAFSIGL